MIKKPAPSSGTLDVSEHTLTQMREWYDRYQEQNPPRIWLAALLADHMQPRDDVPTNLTQERTDWLLLHTRWWRNFFHGVRDTAFITKRISFGTRHARAGVPLSQLIALHAQATLHMHQSIAESVSSPTDMITALHKLSTTDTLLLTRAYEQYRSNRLRQEQEAQATTAARAAFLANMSHELRTPLNGIIGFTSMIGRTTMSATQIKYVEKIRTSSKSLLNLVNDILDFSKIEAGKLNVEAITFKIQDIIEEIGDLFAAEAHKKELELLVSRDQHIPNGLIGDPFRLQQILVNLMSNALKFTEQGHISMRVSLQHHQADQVLLRFEINDTGVGIPEDKLDSMFESFTQADSSTTRKYGGTGLGLSISRQLTELMGGQIGVESAVGQGTTFWVELPFAVEDTTPTSQQTTIDIRDLKTLIVDDNELSRTLLEELSHSFGLNATTAEDGQEALELMFQAAEQDNPFELVLLDWRMPQLDGLETAQIIRESPSLSQVPIILMIAFGVDELQEQGRAIGVNAFLTKPIQQSLMLDTIMRVFSQSPAHATNELQGRPIVLSTESQGAKILVAEDNPINQEVVVSMLTAGGFTPTLVNNGLEVLEMLEQKTFDLVLLDMQMPKLDGYQTAAKIRQDHRFDTLPLIAVTAHAMPKDREKCLRAGMDDYIAKPILSERLFAALWYWLREGRIRSIAPGTPPVFGTADVRKRYAVMPERNDSDTPSRSMLAPPTSADDLLTPIDPQLMALRHFDATEAILRMRGNQTLFRNLLQRLQLEHGQDHTKIRAALNAGCFSLAQQLIHTLKGVVGNVSAKRVRKTIVVLEDAIAPLQDMTSEALDMTVDLSSIFASYETFEKSFLQALAELETPLPRGPRQTPPPDSTKAVFTPARLPPSPKPLPTFGNTHLPALLAMQEAAYMGDIDEVANAIEKLPSEAIETQQCQQLLDDFDLAAIDALISAWLKPDAIPE